MGWKDELRALDAERGLPPPPVDLTGDTGCWDCDHGITDHEGPCRDELPEAVKHPPPPRPVRYIDHPPHPGGRS